MYKKTKSPIDQETKKRVPYCDFRAVSHLWDVFYTCLFLVLVLCLLGMAASLDLRRVSFYGSVPPEYRELIKHFPFRLLSFKPLCQSHSFVTLYKLSAVSQSDKVLISNFWRFDIKLHLRHSSTSTIFLWSQMSIKISLLKFELHGIPFKRMVLTRFKSKISLIWKMCSKVFEPQGSGRDQIIFSYFWRFSPNYFPTKILMLMLMCD